MIDGPDLHLQGMVRRTSRGRNMGHDHIRDNGHAGGLALQISGLLKGIAFLGRGVDHWKIKDIVRGVQLDKEVKDLIHNPVTAGCRLIDLIDNHDDRQMIFKGLFKDEIGLGHGTFLGINQKQSPVGHAQNPLHLTAEVGMSRGVNDIQPVIAVAVRAVFGRNGNSALTFQITGVHKPLGHVLIVTEHARLPEKLINQGRFTMIDMSDDCHVANLILFHFHPS